MCQIVPYTLPCCGKVYVEVSKLPSCPDAWPWSKCPPELCIQVGGPEAEHRAGVCWRCKAKDARKTKTERERMRPGIDRANIVLGLEELDAAGRRKQIERGGNCWFCMAKSGCETCGAGKISGVENEEEGREDTPAPVSSKKKAQAYDDETSSRGKGKGRRTNKRVKVEGTFNLSPVPNSTPKLASASHHIDPLIISSSPHNRQKSAPQPRDNMTTTTFTERMYPNIPFEGLSNVEPCLHSYPKMQPSTQGNWQAKQERWGGGMTNNYQSEGHTDVSPAEISRCKGTHGFNLQSLGIQHPSPLSRGPKETAGDIADLFDVNEHIKEEDGAFDDLFKPYNDNVHNLGRGVSQQAEQPPPSEKRFFHR